MILSYFDLGDVFYNSSSVRNLKSLQILQNKALKYIFKNENYSTDEAHQKANLTQLRDRRLINLVAMTQFRRIIHVRPKLNKNRTLRSTRKLLLDRPRANNAKFDNSFIMYAITYWNCLPDRLKVCTDPSNFKTRVKLELKQGKINFLE